MDLVARAARCPRGMAVTNCNTRLELSQSTPVFFINQNTVNGLDGVKPVQSASVDSGKDEWLWSLETLPRTLVSQDREHSQDIQQDSKAWEPFCPRRAVPGQNGGGDLPPGLPIVQGRLGQQDCCPILTFLLWQG
jgi:hypothetical protein